MLKLQGTDLQLAGVYSNYFYNPESFEPSFFRGLTGLGKQKGETETELRSKCKRV